MNEPMQPITDEDVRTFVETYDGGGCCNDRPADVDWCCARGALTAVAAVRDRRVADQALRDAYWKLREHASGYRGAVVFRRAQDAHRADPSNPIKKQRATVHEWFARGIEAAASEIADMLGEAEHDLQADREAESAAPPADPAKRMVVGPEVQR